MSFAQSAAYAVFLPMGKKTYAHSFTIGANAEIEAFKQR